MSKKDQIYKTALRLFNQNGFEKTPTSLLAKEAGVSTGTLFHYFSTKKDLINRLYLHCKDSMIKNLMVGMDDEQEYQFKLMRIYMNFLHWGMEETAQYLFIQQFCDSIHISENTRFQGEKQFDILIDVIAEGVNQGILQNEPMDYLLELIDAFMCANMNYLIANPECGRDVEFLKKTFYFLWRSIKR